MPLSKLQPFVTEGMRPRFEALCAGQRSALVFAFAYGAGQPPGNVSLYARGMDYYTVNRTRLSAVAKELERAADSRFRVLPNGFPLPIVQAARLAGVGYVGENGLLFCPPYGSFVFLGALTTELALPEGADGGYCRRCGACSRACPTGAIGVDETGARVFWRERCLSHISQQADLTPGQMTLFRRHATLVWGCDLCQLACPDNEGARMTGIPEFRAPLTAHVGEREITAWRDGAADGPHAFLRKGTDILVRNLALIEARTRL